MVKALTFAIGCMICTCAWAQDNHAIGHDEYLGWSSIKSQDCCRGTKNGGDCGILAMSRYRQTVVGPQVFIENKWCPILKEHFVIRGKSPDSATPHVCIGAQQTADPCDRLRCFMGEGGT